MHFGGTLITYSEYSPPGTPQIYNVVDGQQRLTTISILFACIAEKLDETDMVLEKWNAESVRDVLLKNRLDPPDKLKLQDNDNLEYKRILEGSAKGEGNITAAYRVLREAVDDCGPETLMEGLSRFKVINFPCQASNDPQQIFESLNATGIPLTEGEKVKNWLLMGLNRATQDEIYETFWVKIDKCLGGEPKKIDEFLRDFLRWKTGRNVGVRYTYADLRRWWNEYDGGNRTKLCKELARLAELYGRITGTNILDSQVDTLLQYLRDLQVDVHRPFTLRLLDDVTSPETTGAHEEDVVKILEALSTWLTRLWLAGNPMKGLNTQFTDFAHYRYTRSNSYANHWIEKIKKLRHTQIGVPNEKEIGEGIAKRKAYGGKATSTAKTILWAMNDIKSGRSAPLRIEDLSVEHIMPRTLSKEWRDYLGKDTEELQEKYGNSLANLTLVGERLNPEIGNRIYPKKRELYENSSFRLTRELARKYENWRGEDMEARSQELTDLALQCWSWENVTRAKIRWRIGKGDWREEKKYSEMHLNVVAELLDQDPERNSELLLGNQKKDICLSGMEPKSPGMRFKQIPRHEDYVVDLHYSGDVTCKRCTEMAKRCGETIEFEYRNKQRDIWESINPEPTHSGGHPRWRINGGAWNTEKSNASMLPNIVGSILDRNPERNSKQLLGDRISRDIFFSGNKPEGSGRFIPIPRHRQYVVNVNHNRDNILKLCREMGDRCGVMIEAE